LKLNVVVKAYPRSGETEQILSGDERKLTTNVIEAFALSETPGERKT